jgi:hypothetical protein
MWKTNGTAKQATDYNTLQRTLTACWIAKTKDTHSVYEILIDFQRLQNAS